MLTFFFSIWLPLACIVNCFSQTFCHTWRSGVIPVFVRQSLFAKLLSRSSATSLWPKENEKHKKGYKNDPLCANDRMRIVCLWWMWTPIPQAKLQAPQGEWVEPKNLAWTGKHCCNCILIAYSYLRAERGQWKFPSKGSHIGHNFKEI